MDEKKFKNLLTIVVTLFLFGYMIFGTSMVSDTKKDIDATRSELNKAKEQIKNASLIDGDLKVYFLDVGQGDSILIQSKNKNMLIDSGLKDGSTKLVKYLSSLGITKLDYVVATHVHDDHIGGMSDIINNFEIGTFYMPDTVTTTATFEDMLNTLNNKKIKYTVPKIDDEFNLDGAVFKVLSIGNDTTDLNTSSIVLRMIYGDNSFLFMGDAPISVEKSILNKDIKSDVLKVGHHGSNYSTSEAFLSKVKPAYAVISVGKNNSYNHPNTETLNKLSKIDAKIFRTDLNGTILFTTNGSKITVEMISTDTK